jgi:hypothetical protein
LLSHFYKRYNTVTLHKDTILSHTYKKISGGEELEPVKSSNCQDSSPPLICHCITMLEHIYTLSKQARKPFSEAPGCPVTLQESLPCTTSPESLYQPQKGIAEFIGTYLRTTRRSPKPTSSFTLCNAVEILRL